MNLVLKITTALALLLATQASTAVGYSSSQKLASSYKRQATSKLTAANYAFQGGHARAFSPAALVKAGVFKSAPLIGGISKRGELVKYIVLHSTETVHPADAKRIVRSWNGRGKNHPGSQYIVDRDGTIYQTANPDLATMHVNAFKTKYGVNNKNSIGIEIVRTGKQKYTPKQMENLRRLCLYLQHRYDIVDDRLVAHSYVQPSDRKDPVAFDWKQFNRSKQQIHSVAHKHTSAPGHLEG
jgi:hypothetical protein